MAPLKGDEQEQRAGPRTCSLERENFKGSGETEAGKSVQGCKQEMRGSLLIAFVPVYPTGNGPSEFFSKEGHCGLYGRNRVLGCRPR